MSEEDAMPGCKRSLSRVDPVFQLRYRQHATPHLRQLVRSLSREKRPVRPGLALAAFVALALFWASSA